MSPALLLVVGLGCGPVALPPGEAPPVELRLQAVSRRVDSGAPVEVEVVLWTAQGWSAAPGPLDAPGLEAGPATVSGPVLDGGRARQTWSTPLRGADGSYVVRLAAVPTTGPDGPGTPLEVPPLFVDIGVDGPRATGVADFEAAPPVAEGWPAWAWVALTGGAAAGLGLALWARRRRRVAPAAGPPPPGPLERARAEWAEARRRAAAEAWADPALATALSAILRRCVEAVTGWPAPARTTREILAHLEAERLLGPAERARAARILDATDRLKFAREGGGTGFFDALDADFDAVLGSLAPPPVRDAGERP